MEENVRPLFVWLIFVGASLSYTHNHNTRELRSHCFFISASLLLRKLSLKSGIHKNTCTPVVFITRVSEWARETAWPSLVLPGSDINHAKIYTRAKIYMHCTSLTETTLAWKDFFFFCSKHLMLWWGICIVSSSYSTTHKFGSGFVSSTHTQTHTNTQTKTNKRERENI